MPAGLFFGGFRVLGLGFRVSGLGFRVRERNQHDGTKDEAKTLVELRV